MPDIVIKELEQELAASQAREKVLRDALSKLVNPHGLYSDEVEARRMSYDAINQPTDDSALKAALAAERELCASVCLGIVDGQQYAEAIRALGE